MITTQDLFIAQMDSEYTTKEQVILKFIKERDTNKLIEGQKYYYNEPDINDRKIYYYDENEVLKVDDDATNNKDSNNFHKVLVDQKTLYLFGEPMNIEFEDDSLEGYFADLVDREDLDYDISQLGTASANKGVEYLHPYIDEEGSFKYLVIPAEQGIPIYNSSLENEMEAFIRYYPIYDNNVKKLRVEYWDEKTVSYYISDGEVGSVLVPDPTFEDGKHIMSHYDYFGGQAFWESGIPFIEFKNNKKKVGDLQFYKSLIDSYNRTMSDLDNNLEDIQEAILNISGAAGTPAAEIRRNLRYYKMAKTDGPDAKLEALTIEIPIEAKKEMMDRLERNIFVFGQGIDVTNSDLGQKSGTALQFLYQNLDLKANKMEREFQRALNNFFKFVIEYINKDKNTSYTNKDIKLEFVRTKIADKKEAAEVDKVKSETVKNSTNILDLETLIRKHPLVGDKDDIEEIMKRVQAERSGGKEI